jgi:hypothetical protein
MKITAVSIVLAFVVACAFSSSADAGYSRRAQMTGYDATYHSTGKCHQGACAPKRHGTKKPAKPM